MHRIRLGPPWEVVAAEGQARHARKFGRPRIVDANEPVWLVCERMPGSATVSLNGQLIGEAEAGQAFTADITLLLQPRNEVVIVTICTDPLGEVALEIRPA